MSTDVQAESPALVTPSEFDSLNSLLTSNQWPEAVPEYLMCSDSNEDKFERAVGIIDLLSLNLSGKKVLDFGCGEGHLAYEFSHNAAFSLGYDIVKSGNLVWEEGRLTTDWQKVREAGPYDVIVLFDVLDHTQDAVAALEQLREQITVPAFFKDNALVRSRLPLSRRHLQHEIMKRLRHLKIREGVFKHR